MRQAAQQRLNYMPIQISRGCRWEDRQTDTQLDPPFLIPV